MNVEFTKWQNKTIKANENDDTTELCKSKRKYRGIGATGKHIISIYARKCGKKKRNHLSFGTRVPKLQTIANR